ncbi:isochorismatase family protein [Alkalitalea saponilacus]|uniref:Nicotinamidase-related amidase n=1 Tax=Alkalitalea saponilacus TaxID=889453 RepID=A0A1T5F6U1_9BACT|nr:isochorismatase family protein [Alkalitalea saponilacus]ASB50156.1 hydrolase [Alkalitalea saponilacus]SKB91887.1 Nicotinamidase-related amidase [Alkalitalea saponilacus]
MRIEKEQSIAVIIDVQERLFPHIHESEKLAVNLQILIEGLNVLQVPIKVTEQYKKGLGETIPAIANLLTGCKSVEKTAFSCCDEPAFLSDIEKKPAKFVILAGIESHICVLQTALDLKANGFQPVVVEDCVASRNPENKRIAINRMLQEGITVTSYESLLFELCRMAGTDQFKAISKLVK